MSSSTTFGPLPTAPLIDWGTGELLASVPASASLPVPTLITVCLDRSGSMRPTKSDAEGGFDAFIEAQRELGGVCKITLNQFDSQSYDRIYTVCDVDDVPSLTLTPRGGTPLFDAVGRTITDLRAQIAAMPLDNRPAKVIVIVITDGYENASKEYTGPAVADLIAAQPEWEFIYIGAHADAFTQAAHMGFSYDTTLQSANTPLSTAGAYASVTQSVSRSRTGQSANFTSEERQQAE